MSDLTPMERAIIAASDEIKRLTAENARLRSGYAEAVEDIAAWGAYASDYFKEKHDLAGTLSKHRAALEATDDQG